MNNKFKPNGGRAAKSKAPGTRSSRGGARNISSGGLQMAPAAMTRPQGPQKTLQNRRVLTFKEYVQDIAGSVAFSANSFSVQPGLSNLFAWLAAQAINYQEYRFSRLRFVYETEKASSTSGKVMLAFQPDAGDSVPASKQEMLENQNKASNAVWAPCSLNIPVGEALGPRRYVRSGTLAANLDIKTYDLGNLVVATQGCADTTAIGELYVEYTIELFTPVVSAAAQAIATSVAITSGGTVSDSAFLGDAPTYAGGLDATAAGNVITFNRVGRYLVLCTFVGTGLFTSFVPVLTAPSGGSASAPFTGFSNAAANAGTAAVAAVAVVVVTRGTTLTVDPATQATTVSAAIARISQYSVA